MLEVLLAGISVAGATLFLGRHQFAVLKAAVSFHSGEVEAAEKHLDSAIAWPCLPWERNKWALCVNLRIFLAQLKGDQVIEETLCARLLNKKNLATPIQALTYDRLSDVPDIEAALRYRKKSAELWESGAHELEALKMWEMLAYFFWAVAEPARAAYCFEQAPKTPLHNQNVYLCYLCYKEQDLPIQTIVKAGRRVLRVSKTDHLKATIHSSLADVYYDAGNYPEAHTELLTCLELGTAAVRENALRTQIRILRAMDNYEEALEARSQWLGEVTSGRWMKEMGLLHDEGQYLACLELLKAQPDPESIQFQYARGIVHLELGDPATAARAMEYAITYQANPSPLWNLVRAHGELMSRDKIEEFLHLLLPQSAKATSTVRARLAYFWDGQPEVGKALGVEWLTAFYHGDFERFASGFLEEAEKKFAHAPHDFKRANLSFHRGVALRWEGQIEDALKAFKEAESSFESSPFQAACAQLRALECRAALQEDVRSELEIFGAELRARYPSAHRSILKLESVKLHCLFHRREYREVVAMTQAYLKKEKRKFQKARHLKLKVLAQEALGLIANAELQAISNLVPESFLACWAESRL